jgi:hypothetical protein
MAQIQGTNTPTGAPTVLKSYSNARKLFQVSDLPIAVMSYGAGNIGPRSIQGLMIDFKPSPNLRDVKGVADELFKYIKPIYDTEFGKLSEKPLSGFYIAGYSPNSPFADEWEFLLPRETKTIKVPRPSIFGSSWRGIDIPFLRLAKGYDPRIMERLKAAGVSQTQLDAATNGLEMAVVLDAMPLQDAINYAAFILRTTIGMATFEAGAPSCGGPLQVAIILRDKGFEWIENPKLEVQVI